MILNTSKILYPNNVEKLITDVKVGDVIIGYDESIKEFGFVEVLSKKSKEYNQIVEITFADDTKLEITEEHPIYSDNGWVSYNIEESKRIYKLDCKEIKVNDNVLTKDNTHKNVKSINVLNKTTTCYTLNVTDSIDTYIVDGIVVHNAVNTFTINKNYLKENVWYREFPLGKGYYLVEYNTTSIESGMTTVYTPTVGDKITPLHSIDDVDTYADKIHAIEGEDDGGGLVVADVTTDTITDERGNVYTRVKSAISIICTRDSSKDTTHKYYTKSATPAVGDTIYNKAKEDSGLVVKSISGNTMVIEPVAKATLTYTLPSYYYNAVLVDMSINGESLGISVGTFTYELPVGKPVSIVYTVRTDYSGAGVNIINSSDTSLIANNTYWPSFLSYDKDPVELPVFNMPADGISFTYRGRFDCCIPYYSNILMADNTAKPAENIKVGDMVVGYNEKTKEFEDVEVLNIIHKVRPDLVKVTFVDDTFLEVTPDHPVLTDGGWAAYETNSLYSENNIQLHKLTTEDKVLQCDGSYKQIKSIELNVLDKPIDVYTYDVTNTVNTFVAENCVIHNEPC